jgi:hypothetical protein
VQCWLEELRPEHRYPDLGLIFAPGGERYRLQHPKGLSVFERRPNLTICPTCPLERGLLQDLERQLLLGLPLGLSGVLKEHYGIVVHALPQLPGCSNVIHRAGVMGPWRDIPSMRRPAVVKAPMRVLGFPRSFGVARGHASIRTLCRALVRLGARWGPADPGAASCKSGLYQILRDIRVAKGNRAVTGDGLPIFLGSMLALDVFVVLRRRPLLEGCGGRSRRRGKRAPVSG